MRAGKVLVATVLICHLLSADARAQPDAVLKDGKLIIQLNLKPNDYLRPVSRGLLLPEYSESIPGNRVQMFLRCFCEQDFFFGKAETERRDAWNKLPLGELPVAELKDYGSPLLSDYAYDAAHDPCGLAALVFPAPRWVSNSAARRAAHACSGLRHQNALGKIASAILRAHQSLKTMFGLARTLESQPT